MRLEQQIKINRAASMWLEVMRGTGEADVQERRAQFSADCKAAGITEQEAIRVARSWLP